MIQDNSLNIFMLAG